MTEQEKFYKMEAYGTKKDPSFLYSKHNLHIKYGTEKAFEILASRIQTLKDFGYDPSERPLTPEEKEAACTLDYVDALLQTYDDRVTAAAEHRPYLDSLNSNMEPNCDWPEPTDPRAMCQMLSYFCASMEIVQLVISDYGDEQYPEFIRAWYKEVRQRMHMDHYHYIHWRDKMKEIADRDF